MPPRGKPLSSRILVEMAYRYGGYGYPYAAGAAPAAAALPLARGFAGSVRLSDELKQEEDFLGAR